MAKKPVKDNQFDEYRENLVMETKTSWSEGVTVPEADQQRIVSTLHSNPKETKKLEYIRSPTGFVRHITVTQEDLDRLASS